MRLFTVVLLAGLTFSGDLLANGRAPATSTINFRKGMESQIAAGMTFGVVHSNDNGATWTWVCEEAVGYGGMYDPDYAFTSTGALFATTFDGLKVNRDGCSYTRTTLIPTDGPCFDDDDPDREPNNCNAGFTCSGVGGGQGGGLGDGICEKIKFVSATTVGPTGLVYAAAADPADGKIYKSTDDGVTFPGGPQPGQLGDWWQSIEVAPTNANIIYLFGYRFAQNTKTFLLFKSTDGGDSYQPLPGNGDVGTVNGIVTMPNSVIEIAGISKTNPDIVYARVTLADNSKSDALYRSIDGGQSWAKLIELEGATSFVARANGELVAGTQALGIHRATETGNATVPVFTQVLPSIPCTENAGTFTCPTGQACTEETHLCEQPHVGCLAENSAGEVWACTQNYGSPTVPKDGFGIMKTTDLTNWSGVLLFQNLVDPVGCAAGTVQKDRCDAQLWCGLCAQLGCDPNRNCEITGDGAPDGLVVNPPKKTCCQSGGDDIPGLLIICVAVSLVVLRRRPVRPL
jgi:hypothetical protein